MTDQDLVEAARTEYLARFQPRRTGVSRAMVDLLFRQLEQSTVKPKFTLRERLKEAIRKEQALSAKSVSDEAIKKALQTVAANFADFQFTHGRRSFRIKGPRAADRGDTEHAKIFITLEAIATESYSTYQEVLCALGVFHPHPLIPDGVRSHFSSGWMIDFSGWESTFNAFEGIEPLNFLVVMASKLVIPAAVSAAKRKIPKPLPNNQKVAVTRWAQQSSDRGESGTGSVIVHLARTDWWDAMAFKQAAKEVLQELKNGTIPDLAAVPQQLRCHMIVVTQDDKILLAKRAGRDQVADRPGEWGISIGEGTDAKRDFDMALGVVHPRRTVVEALKKHEELGLGDEIADRARTIFLGRIVEIDLFVSVLVCLIRVRATASELNERLTMLARDGKGEIASVDFLDMNLRSCADVLLEPDYTPQGNASLRGKVYATSRLGLLAAMIHEFGWDVVLDELRERLAARKP